MDKMYQRFKSVLLLCIIAGTGLLCSCMDDGNVDVPEKGGGVSEGFMRIHLNLPDLLAFDPSKAATRAMDNDAERAIDPSLLNILVFKSNGGGSETFYYKAPVSGSITYEDAEKRMAIVTVKLVKSEGSNDKFRIVVVANHSMDGVPMTEDVTTKEEVLEGLVFPMPDKWNAGDGNSTPFPMWGENENPVEITENVQLDAINMYRALARVDVGLNFESVDNVLSENALGLDAFKIKEIKVYRTYTGGFVAPLDASQIYTQPSIPSGAVRRADNAPLEFEVAETGGADKFVREIYLPEAGLPASPASGNMHCIVVGGYYKGSNSITYYRLNFAETGDNGDVTHYPILRNHRYTFNIQQITGPGYATATEALNSEGFAGNMSYDLIVWDENIHEVQVMGKYYLGLDNRNVRLSANKDTIGAPNTLTINYQTNYPLSASDTLGLKWKEGSLFKAVWNSSTNSIAISANTENVSNTVLTDTLYVRAGLLTIPVRVEQSYVNFRYTINCATVNVNGTYTAGSALTTSNTISLTLVAEDPSIIGKKYIIETEDLTGDHGISFRVEGTFTAQTMNVVLAGSGTLSSSATEPFVLRINSNSSNGAFCEATIIPVGRKMNILVLGNISNAYGYAISRLNGGAGQVFNYPGNFGSNNNSIVKMPEINYITSASYAFGQNSDPYKWVTGLGNEGKIADLVYFSYPAYISDAGARLLMEYLDKGGVVVAFLQEALSEQTIARYLFNNNSITSQDGGAAGHVFPFPAHPILVGQGTEAQREILRKFEGDPIVNGPFGDVRDKQWGEDASVTRALSNFPATDPNVTIYSYARNISTTGTVSTSTNVTGYKYESATRNLVWFGDGGFMSSDYDPLYPYNGVPTNTSNIICPFKWDAATMFPIPKPNYGVSSVRWDVYNSIAFCNIMAWAVEKSLSLQSKRDN